MSNANDLILRVTEFGYNNEKFSLNDLRDKLSLTPDEFKFLDTHLALKVKDGQATPNHIVGVLTYVKKPDTETATYRKKDWDYSASWYRLLPSAYFSFIDHLEIVEARKNAEFAKASAATASRQSRTAIYISIAAMVVSFIFGLWQVSLTKEANQLTKDSIELNKPLPQPNVNL